MCIKTSSELQGLRESGRRLARVLHEVARAVRPGVTTGELDALAERLIRAGGDTPSFKNYQPAGAKRAFPAALCVSVNDEVVHGIPGARILREGDLAGLDLGLVHEGFFTDMAVTVPVGVVDEKGKKLLEVTREALGVGIQSARAGKRVGDISHAIEMFLRPHGYGIIRELGGHGVGRAVHEPPYIANFGKPGTGAELREGEVVALEPMCAEGGWQVKLAPNKFAFVTRDGSRSAHFEHTIVITGDGAEVMTII